MAVNIFQALDAGLEDPEVAVGPEVIRGLLAREASDGGGLWPGVRNRGQMEDVHRCQGDQGPHPEVVGKSQTAKLGNIQAILGTSPANNIGFDGCDSKLSTLIMHHLAAQQIHR